MINKNNFKFRKLIFSCFIIFIGLGFASCKKDDDKNNNNNGEGEEAFSHTLAAGESAHEFLSDDEFRELVVEIQYADGHSPTDETMNNIGSFFREYVKKPEGITLFKSKISVDKGGGDYSLKDIREIEDEYRTHYSSDGKITAYIFYADKDYAGNSSNSTALGIAYRNTSMVLFEKTIRDYSGGLTQPSRAKLETTVSNHEIGHVLGLVNNGSAMQDDHQDTDNGKHCDNENCLMYYTVETADVVDNLVGSEVPELDQNCKNDLSSNGGK